MTPAEIEKAVGKPLLLRDRVFRKDTERQRVADAENLDLRDVQLDLTGWKLRVDIFRTATDNGARNADDRLFAHPAECFESRRAGVDDQLDDTVVITKIDEQDAAEVTTVVEPTRKPYLLTDLALPEFAAGV
jgi:hypothetical protein